MARPRKDYIAFHVKADAEIMRRFEEYCDAVGQTKTTAFERIIAAFLDQYEADKKADKKRK